MDKYMLQKKEALIFTWGWGERSLNKQDSHPKSPFHQLLVFILYLMQTATNVSCSVFLLTEVTVEALGSSGARKNKRARGRHARGEGAPSPLACLPLARPFFFGPARQASYSQTLLSLRVREARTVLDSGWHALDSGFQVLDSSICQWNLDREEKCDVRLPW